MSLPMQIRSKIRPKTIIIIMTKKFCSLKKLVVRIRCPVKLEPTVFAGKNATCAVFNIIKLIKRAGAGYYLRHLLAVSSRHQQMTVV